MKQTAIVKWVLLATLLPVVGWGAVLITETFSGGASGWGDRDAGEMAVTHQASVGSPASAAMQGRFGAQGFAVSQTDAFRVNTGNFMGDYTGITGDPGITGFILDLYADNVMPSDASLRFSSGGLTFFYALNLGSMAVDTWTHFTVSLAYSPSWQGGDQAAFNNALLTVTNVEVQLTRNGTGVQYFYLDNFGTTDQVVEIGTAVPEPSSGMLVLFFGVMLLGARKHLADQVDEEEEFAGEGWS